MAERIGFIGLGPMGAGMARRLVDAGKSLVVCDLNLERLKALTDIGAEAAPSAAEVARRCDIVFTSLPSPEVFAKVAGNDLLPNARKGQVFIDVGTSLIKDTRRLAKKFSEKGASLLEAPVSGGARGSSAGTLHIFVGGDEAVYKRVRPILELIGQAQRIVYFGPSGSGQIAKVVNQLAMGLVNAAFIEAIFLAEAQGVKAELLGQGVGGDTGWRKHFADIASQIARGKGNDIGVKAMELEEFLAEAHEAGIGLPLTQALEDFTRDGEKTLVEGNRPPGASYWRELMRKALKER